MEMKDDGFGRLEGKVAIVTGGGAWSRGHLGFWLRTYIIQNKGELEWKDS